MWFVFPWTPNRQDEVPPIPLPLCTCHRDHGHQFGLHHPLKQKNSQYQAD
jgi:hypothetical protein